MCRWFWLPWVVAAVQAFSNCAGLFMQWLLLRGTRALGVLGFQQLR